jgi:DNA processing protein
MDNDVDADLALLALWEHAHERGEGSDLARALSGGCELCSLLDDPHRTPSPRHWAMARYRHAAVRAMAIAVLPVSACPPWIQRVPQRPALLFVRGDVRLLFRSAVAVVGARRASAEPEKWAYECARKAARDGWVVVSGGACGIDAAAHNGAMDGGSQTIAYLGVAADRIYPKSNAALFLRLLRQGGALVSEHPPRSATFRYDHSRRNRLIAGHASRLIVAEAAVGSGSLGTAAVASRLGVPIWVPPRRIGGARGGIDSLLLEGRARVMEL